LSRAWDRGFAAGATADDNELATDYERATGLERQELDGKAKGIDIFKEDWLDLPFGTEANPVKVPSIFSERVVGVPDPYDDSIIWWGCIKEGEGPRQIVEGGEFFVLERNLDESAGHGHH
jgi:cytochrome c oxidase subunit 5b